MIIRSELPTVGIPDGWKMTELSSIVDINPESRDPTQNPDEKFSYIDIDSVENGGGVITSVKKLIGRDAPSRARRIVRTDDVIMSEVRPYLKAFALVPKKLNNQICSTGFAVLRSKGLVDPKYLLNTLFSDAIIEQCTRMMVGAQYPALNDSQVKKIQIPLPPLPEQRRIATILTTVDDAIQRSRQAAAETERLKAGVMQELMTKGIGHTEFKEDPDVGKVPKEWEIRSISELCDTTSGGTPSRSVQEFYKGSIPWLKSGELNDGVITSTEECITEEAIKKSATKIIPKGTVLIALYGATVGKVGILGIDSAINQAICALFIKNALNPKYLFNYLLFSRNRLLEIRTGGAQPNISQDIIKSLKLPLPPPSEQKLIVTILSAIDRKLSLQRQRTTHYERLKQGLMNELLTGKRRVKVT